MYSYDGDMVDNDIIRCCIWFDSSMSLFHREVDSVVIFGTMVEAEDGNKDGVMNTESNNDGPNKLL